MTRPVANVKTLGTFCADGATRNLWLTGPGQVHKVHRIRVEHTYEKRGEYATLARFDRLYGNPVTTDGGRRVFAQERNAISGG